MIQEDGLPDDRVTCAQCTQLDRGREWCRPLEARTVLDTPRRCERFRPLHSLADRRTGAQRWPGLDKTIEEVRSIDREYEANRWKKANP